MNGHNLFTPYLFFNNINIESRVSLNLFFKITILTLKNKINKLPNLRFFKKHYLYTKHTIYSNQ
uniref:Uncharacterized protein n=1 Tax=Arsenophonus nasoniae TaxID=638 RepID=D2U1F0_9GAMM|nr:hypothetical protein ARN_23700 [Arsenophonus nasoniae]